MTDLQATEWARIDANGNLVFLDMGQCKASLGNPYAALGIGVWNAAIEEAAKEADFVLQPGGKTLGDTIRVLKK